MPIIGSLSDSYGRRLPYLLCLVGISLSYLLWIRSEAFFSIFVLFRTLGGLSKGNISLSTAIVTDVSSEEKRGKGFAMIGIAFSLGFIVSVFCTHINYQLCLITKSINVLMLTHSWDQCWEHSCQVGDIHLRPLLRRVFSPFHLTLLSSYLSLI